MIDSLGAALASLRTKDAGLIIGEKIEAGQVVKMQDKSYLVMFKREYYQNFKYHFPNVKKENGNSYGYAQIMGKDMLSWACKNVDFVLFVTPDNKMYKCPPKIFQTFVDIHQTIVPHLTSEVAMPLDFFEAY
jgi:hypothetical protein